MEPVCEIRRGGTEAARWEMAVRPVPRALRPYVRAWVGWEERAAAPVVRRELPGTRVVAILELGAPMRLHVPDPASGAVTFGAGFCAGLGGRPTLTRHDGHQRCVQLDLTPAGARLLFGRPLSELAEQVVDLAEVLPGAAPLLESLDDTADWGTRLARVEGAVGDLLARRLRDKRAPDLTVVTWACDRIAASGGRVDVAQLVRELGYSHNHVIARFRDGVGVAPKLLCRLTRFDALVQRIRAGDGRSMTELAYALGFTDPSHLVREVRAFAEVTPSALRAEYAPPAG